ncbi:MAG: zf-TFIIB domain-containing protein [Planctomycetota bacterium]
MDCPACKNAMIVLELAEAEIDYCENCAGIWLDAGEMELLLGDGEKSRALISSFRKAEDTGEQQRKCPICDKKMEKAAVGKDEKVLTIDRCARGDGLWFDKGELNEIIDKAKFDEGNKIKELLADMFGHNSEDR